MANIKSQLKRIKQARVATARNKAERSRLKTLIIKFNQAVEEKDKTKASDLFATTAKSLDKSVTKGILHLNRAASKKSTLHKRLNTIK